MNQMMLNLQIYKIQIQRVLPQLNIIVKNPQQILKEDLQRLEKGDYDNFSNLATQMANGHQRHVIISLLADLLYPENDLKDVARFMKRYRAERDSNQESDTSTGTDALPSTPEIITSIPDSLPDPLPDDVQALLARQKSSRLAAKLKKIRQKINENWMRMVGLKKQNPNATAAVERPDALPMGEADYHPKNEFADLCNFLSGGGVDVDANIRFQHGTINSDGRFDMCKQGFAPAFKEVSEAVVNDGGGNATAHANNNPNIRFQHGTINSDGRFDMCKQGFAFAFKEVSEAVVNDGGGNATANASNNPNVRFQHGTIDSDGRFDMCKQGFAPAFKEVSEAVVNDGGGNAVANANNNPNIRFQHGTINSDGRFDMCKQGFASAFKGVSEAVVNDGINPGKQMLFQRVQAQRPLQRPQRTPLIKHYLIGNNKIGENDTETPSRVDSLCWMIRNRPDIVTWFLAGNTLNAGAIKKVARALEATNARYLWLKMNPIQIQDVVDEDVKQIQEEDENNNTITNGTSKTLRGGAYWLGICFAKNPSLELLDMFNVGLTDVGLREFNQGLKDAMNVLDLEGGVRNLKHLYE